MVKLSKKSSRKFGRRCVLFSFYKLDSVTRIGIPGAKFQLKSCKRASLQTAISDCMGLVSFKVVPCQIYILREIASPKRYAPNKTEYVIMVDHKRRIFVNGVLTPTLNIPNVLITGEFSAVKINSVTGMPIAGAVFALSQNGAQIAASISGIDGVISFSNISPGTYTLTEITPASGYLPNPTIFTVIVDNSGEVTINGIPAEGFTINNIPIAQSLPPAINTVAEGDSTVTGNGMPGCLVTVTFPDGSTAAAIVSVDGTWSVPVPDTVDLVSSTVIIVVQACPDELPSEPVIVVVKPRQSSPPTINTVTEGDDTITGNGNPGCLVTVIFPDGSTETVIVSTDGTWSVPVPDTIDLVPGEVVSAVQTCCPGELPSEPEETIVQPTQPQSPPPTINTVTEGDSIITGTGNPGCSVTVIFPDGSTVTVVVAVDGSWSASVPATVDLAPGEAVSAVQTCPDELPSEPVETIVQPAQPQSPPPTINTVTEGDSIITGTGNPGCSVTVTFPDGSTATVTVSADETWSALVPAAVNLVQGEFIIAVQTCPDELPSEPVITVVQPLQSPPPTIDTVLEGDSTITGTGNPGCSITVTFPDGSTGFTIVLEDGTWSVPVPDTVDLLSGNVIIAVQTCPDELPSNPRVVIVEPRPQSPPPIIDTVLEGDSVITGSANPGCSVTVTFPDGSTDLTIVLEDGTWSVPVPGTVDLFVGNVIIAVQTCPDELPSNPTVTIVEPRPQSPPPTINTVLEGDSVITGNANPGCSVTVTFPDGSTDLTIVSEDGTWSVPVPDTIELLPGEFIIAVQTCPDELPSTPTVTIVEPRPQSPPPIINTVTEGDSIITGNGNPGCSIMVTFPDGSTDLTIVSEDGTWSVPVAVDLIPGDLISAVQTCPDELPSEPTETIVQPPQSPPPDINLVLEGDSIITGSGNPGCLITVMFPDGSIELAIVSEDGTWSVPVPETVYLLPGNIISAIQTCSGALPSDPAETIIQPSPSSPPPNINIVFVGDCIITGNGNPGCFITVIFPDGSTGLAIVSEDGTWAVPVPDTVELLPGNFINAVQTCPDELPSIPVQIFIEPRPQSPPPNINPVYEGDRIIIGNGNPGCFVTVTFPDGSDAMAIISSEGIWLVSVPCTIDLIVDELISVVQLCPDELPIDPSIPVEIIVEPRLQSPPPIINPVYEGDRIITGDGTPCCLVTVTFSDGSTVTIIVPPEGTWVVPVPCTIDLVVDELISAVQACTDELPSEPTEVFVELRPQSPSPNVIDPVIEGNDNHVYEGQRIIIGNGIPCCLVTVTFPDGSEVTTIVSPDGIWMVPVPCTIDLIVGNLISVVQACIDELPSDPTEIIVELRPQSLQPIINPVFEGDCVIRGVGNPGCLVTVTFPDDSTVTTIVSVNGTWAVLVPDTVDLIFGNIIFAAQACPDELPSDPAEIIVEPRPQSPPPNINPVFEGDRTIMGFANPGCLVAAIFPNGPIVTTTVSFDGNWVISLSNSVNLISGDVISVVQTCPDELTSIPAEIIVEPRQQSLPPSIDSVIEGALTISGVGIPGCGILVTFPGDSVVSTIVPPNSSWNVSVPFMLELLPGDLISAVQICFEESPSDPAVTIVQPI